MVSARGRNLGGSPGLEALSRALQEQSMGDVSGLDGRTSAPSGRCLVFITQASSLRGESIEGFLVH
jgi:hypothetical protein